MRTVFIMIAAATALAQPAPQTRLARSSENFRGASAVSEKIAWASGTHGTYLRTTDGRIWLPDQVPGAEALDFRGVVAFSADEAFLMSAGPGDQSRIYHTINAGRNWNLQFTNSNPKGFFDSIVFWDRTHGIVLGDPVPDEKGILKFELLITEDGQTWTHIPPAQLPPALEGEGAFAASNSCIAILSSTHLMSTDRSVILSGETWAAERTACRSRRTPCIASSPNASQGLLPTEGVTTTAQVVPISWQSGSSTSPKPSENEAAPDPNIWFATGGKVARVFHSPDRGRTWQVFDTPIVHGSDSQGIFSIAFRDPTHGVIAGGDYKHPDQDGPNLAFTNDGGKTWTLSQIFPQSYYSAVAYDRKLRNPNSANLNDNQANARLFIVGNKFIYDFHPPRNPTRISPRKKSDLQFNAVIPFPAGGALFVGAKGSITTLP